MPGFEYESDKSIFHGLPKCFACGYVEQKHISKEFIYLEQYGDDTE